MPDLGSGRKRTHTEYTLSCAGSQQPGELESGACSTTPTAHFQSLLSEDEGNTKPMLVSAKRVKRDLPHAIKDSTGIEKALDSPDPLQAESPDALPSPLDLPRKSYGSGHASNGDREMDRRTGRKQESRWDAMDRYKRANRDGADFGRRDVKAIPIHQYRPNSMVSRFAPKPQNTLRRSIIQSQNASQSSVQSRTSSRDPHSTPSDNRGYTTEHEDTERSPMRSYNGSDHQSLRPHIPVRSKDLRKQQLKDLSKTQHVPESRQLERTLFSGNKNGKKVSESHLNITDLDTQKSQSRHAAIRKGMLVADIEDFEEAPLTIDNDVAEQSPVSDDTQASPVQFSESDVRTPALQHKSSMPNVTEITTKPLLGSPQSVISYANHEANRHLAQDTTRAVPRAVISPDIAENGQNLQGPKWTAQQLLSLFETNSKLANAVHSKSSSGERLHSQIKGTRQTNNVSHGLARSSIPAHGTVPEQAISELSDDDSRQVRSKKPKLAHGMQTDLSIDELSGLHEDKLSHHSEAKPVPPVKKALRLLSKRSTRKASMAPLQPVSPSAADREHPLTPTPTTDLKLHVAESWSCANPEYLNQWKTELIWPPDAKVRVSVNVTDIEKLDEEQFLNDNLINFYLRYLELKYEEARKPDDPSIFFFNTFFYQRLSSGTSSKTINYDAVKRWTSKVDIFQYDYIVVPINEHLHWYLALICNPRKLMPQELQSGNECSSPEDSHSSSQDKDTTVVHPSSFNHDDKSDRTLASVRLPSTKPRSSSFDVPMQNLTLLDSMPNVQEPGKQGVKGTNATQQKSLLATIDQKVATTEDDAISDIDLQTNFTDDLSKSRQKAHGKIIPRGNRTTKEYRLERIITFDSLGHPHSPACTNLRSYLSCEAKARHEVNVEVGMPKGLTAKGIPEQPNLSDCGLYLLAYVQKFLQNPSEFHKNILRSSSDIDWTGLDSSKLRKHIRDKLLDLHEQQVLRERAAKLSRSKVNQAGKHGNMPAVNATVGNRLPQNPTGAGEKHGSVQPHDHTSETNINVDHAPPEAQSTHSSTPVRAKSATKPWQVGKLEKLADFRDQVGSSKTVVGMKGRGYQENREDLPVDPSLLVTRTVDVKMRPKHRHDDPATRLRTTVGYPTLAIFEAEESGNVHQEHPATPSQHSTNQGMQANSNYASPDGDEAIEIPDSRPSSPTAPDPGWSDNTTESRKRRSNTDLRKSETGKRVKDARPSEVDDELADLNTDPKSSFCLQTGKSSDKEVKADAGDVLLLSRADRMAGGQWRHKSQSVIID